MLGWINRSIKDFVVSKFGQEAWDKILEKYPHDTQWQSQCPYSDGLTVDLVVTAASHLGVTVAQALEAYGEFFVSYMDAKGYNRMIEVLGSTLYDFLLNLNNLHLFLLYSFPQMVPPSFMCERFEDSKMLRIQYFSVRQGLYPIVIGIVKCLAHKVFGIEVEIKLINETTVEDGSFQYTMDIVAVHGDIDQRKSLCSGNALKWVGVEGTHLEFSSDEFYAMFPFAIFMNESCRLVSISPSLRRITNMEPKSFIGEHVDVVHPQGVALEAGVLLGLTKTNTACVLKLKSNNLELKGQFIKYTPKDAASNIIIFLCSPRVRNLDDMTKFGIFMSDMPSHDSCTDMVMLSELRVAEVQLSKRIEVLNLELEHERQRSDRLLYQMLPVKVAESLRCGQKVPAQHYQEVTILFSDMVGFTKISAKSNPENVFRLLDDLYSALDTELAMFPEIYKVETIGDAYMLVANLTVPCENHVDRMIQFATRMLAIATTIKSGVEGVPVQLRVGMHTGSVVAGVVGKKMPGFALFGDTVNTASRMETTSLVSQIHISDDCRRAIRDDSKFAIESRGGIEVKGKGLMHTHFVKLLEPHA